MNLVSPAGSASAESHSALFHEAVVLPEEEVLIARDGRDVVDHVRALTAQKARSIGAAALRRVLAEHTYAHRGAEVDALLRQEMAERVAEVAA